MAFSRWGVATTVLSMALLIFSVEGKREVGEQSILAEHADVRKLQSQVPESPDEKLKHEQAAGDAHRLKVGDVGYYQNNRWYRASMDSQKLHPASYIDAYTRAAPLKEQNKKKLQTNVTAKRIKLTVDTNTTADTMAKHDPFANDPFANDPFFNQRQDPVFERAHEDNMRHHEQFRQGRDPVFERAHEENLRHHEDFHRSSVLIIIAMISGFFFLVCGVPSICCCIGYHRARGIQRKMEEMKLAYPQMDPRVPTVSLSDGMTRLSQESRVLIRQNVNKLQELSTHLAGYSIQTANSFEVVSATPGAPDDEVLLACREAQDLQALVGMNLGGLLAAGGVEAGEHFAGRDKAPFRMSIGLPRTDDKAPGSDNVMQVIVPEGVGPGQQIIANTPDGQQVQVSVPPGVSSGMTFPVILPKTEEQQGFAGGAMQVLNGLAPGSEPNTDMPFLFLDRPFAMDCCCFMRPHLTVYDVRGGVKVQLGVISDPFAWVDMTFNLHIGPTATEETPPALIVKGPACQPGAHCQLCGLCCGRRCQEVYLEVIDPKTGQAVAFITKGWAGAFKEILTQANSFYVDFGEVTDPAYKAMLIAIALFVDYRFFEGRSGKTGPHDSE